MRRRRQTSKPLPMADIAGHDYGLLRMDRILCVVQELTDDSCRERRCTIHKRNWTKPLGHRGSALEDCKGAWWIGRGGGPNGTLSESPRHVAMSTSSLSFPAFRHPRFRLLA